MSISSIAIAAAMTLAIVAAGFAYDWWNRRLRLTHDLDFTIADQGDDWVPFYWSGRKTYSTTVLITPDFWSSVGISFDETRPAWHSAVGVEIVTRGDK